MNSLDESCEVVSPTFVQEAEAKVAARTAGSAAQGGQEVAAPAEAPAPAVTRVPEVEPGPGDEFIVDLVRDPNDSVGMDLDLIDGITPLVVATKAGTIENWNQEHPALAVKAGDKIHEVNDVRGKTADIIATLKKDTTWRIILQRPRELVLNIVKNSAPSMGLELAYSKNGNMLLINDVNEGPVLDWNLDNPQFQVQGQDRIIEINGTKGNALELLQCSEGSDKLCMKVLHYPNLARYESDGETEEEGMN